MYMYKQLFDPGDRDEKKRMKAIESEGCTQVCLIFRQIWGWKCLQSKVVLIKKRVLKK